MYELAACCHDRGAQAARQGILDERAQDPRRHPPPLHAPREARRRGKLLSFVHFVTFNILISDLH